MSHIGTDIDRRQLLTLQDPKDILVRFFVELKIQRQLLCSFSVQSGALPGFSRKPIRVSGCTTIRFSFLIRRLTRHSCPYRAKSDADTLRRITGAQLTQRGGQSSHANALTANTGPNILVAIRSSEAKCSWRSQNGRTWA